MSDESSEQVRHFTYEDKLKALAFLADPQHWRVRNITRWLEDIDRQARWNTNLRHNAKPVNNLPDFVGGVAKRAVTVSDSCNYAMTVVHYQGNGHRIIFERYDTNLFIIRDNANRILLVNDTGLTAEDPAITHQPLQSKTEIKAETDLYPSGVSERFAATVVFRDDGTKAIFLHDRNQKIIFPACEVAPTPLADYSGRFFHEINIPYDLFPDRKDWEIGNFVKLVLAEDVGLEGGGVSTAIEKHGTGKFVWQLVDSTEFDGFQLGAANNFSVELGKSQLQILTASDMRDRILTHAQLCLRIIRKHGGIEDNGWRTKNTWSCVVSHDTKMIDLRDLAGNDELRRIDHRTGNWHYIVLHGDSTLSHRLFNTRAFCVDACGLEKDHVHTLRFEDNFGIVLLHNSALNKIQGTWDNRKAFEQLLSQQTADNTVVTAESVTRQIVASGLLTQTDDTKLVRLADLFTTLTMTGHGEIINQLPASLREMASYGDAVRAIELGF